MIKQARHNGDVIRRASKTTVVLQVFSVALLLGLAFMAVDIVKRYSTLQDGIRENALWSVYQFDREARRLHELVHLYLAQGPQSGIAVKTLTTRYDILYSRMNILEQANFERQFVLNPEIGQRIAAIQDTVYGIVAPFDALAAGKDVAKEQLLEVDGKLETLLGATEDLVIFTNNWVSTNRAEKRSGLMTLQVQTVVLVGLLVACVFFLIFNLRRQLRSVRRAGLDLEAMATELNESYLAAEAGNRAKSQFMATMGHEVRTPLNAILGTAELLELQTLPQGMLAGVQTIRRSGNALLELINEILDYAKIEHGNVDVEMRPVGVRALAESTIEMVRDRASENGNLLELALPDNFTMPVILSDPTRLRQITLNLLSNAIKFTKDGVVTLRIAELVTSGPGCLRVEVSDTGIGIDNASIDKLFQPFSQVDSSISRKYGGTGLGLTICKQIVEAMDGRIGVESVRGKGSTFWFEIPVKPARIEESEDHGMHDAQAAVALKTLHILLVEDNAVNQQVAAGFLRHLGQNVKIANDGFEAISAFENDKFDLILMDMQMPNLDGIEATRRIRALPDGQAVSIIAMTANASEDDRRLCHEAGMTGFETKPVTMPKLRDIIARTEQIVDPGQMASVKAAPPERDSEFDTLYEQRRAELIEALGEEGFNELLDSFFEDAREIILKLRSTASPKDQQTIDHLLHAMKGAAASVGLGEIAATAQAFRSGDFSPGRLEELEHLLDAQKHRLAA
ncbi:hybrid sensor histidine kinase/response regulator [Metarhizobium album]|uniref:histidine kinase n=1 Tax=Metarhizobium album TaxID=2182425 RepID=A0A2U2DNJ8_9HYPH|nr:ATP-binding protein [Rhizobium album]PWE54887.1 hybrid sensor histidine kinase/response regulator [Rhizobium album]